MTPDQRRMIAAHVADTTPLTPWGAAIRACLAQADRYVETERRLGEARAKLAEVEQAHNAAGSAAGHWRSACGNCCDTLERERREHRAALAASERDAALGRKLRAWRCPNCAEPIGYAKLCEMCADCFAVEAIAATRAESTKPEGCE